MPIFKTKEGKKYDVADKDVDYFAKDYPDAITIGNQDGKDYQVKASDYSYFMGWPDKDDAVQNDEADYAAPQPPTMEEKYGKRPTFEQMAEERTPRPTPLRPEPEFKENEFSNAILTPEKYDKAIQDIYRKGGLESTSHPEEDARINKEYQPKEVKTSADSYMNAHNKFMLTERGKQLDKERADIEAKVIDDFAKDFRNSRAYKEIIAKRYGSQEERSKALNDAFIKEYGDAIEKRMQPYYDVINDEIFNRYGNEVQTDIHNLEKENVKSVVSNLKNDTERLIREHSKNAPRVAIHGSNALTSMWQANQGFGKYDRDVEVLKSANDILRESQNIIDEAAKKGNTNFVAGLGRGFWDNLNAKNFSFGLADLADMNYLHNALQKSERGEQLTEAEEKLLEASVINMATQAYYSSDLGRGYKAGGVTAESIPFMLEFIVNPISGSGNVLAKSLLKFGLRKFGHVAATKGAKFAGRLLGDAAAATGMLATSSMPRVIAGAEQRMTDNYDYGFDENGELQRAKLKENPMSYGEAFGRSVVSNFLENQSEMVFNAFKGWSPITSLMEKVAPGFTNKVIKGLSNTKAGRLYHEFKNNATLQDMMQRAQFHGLPEEYMEEVYNNFASIPMGEMTAEEALDLDNNIDTFLGVAPTSVVFGAIGLGTMAHDRYVANKRINEIYKNATEEERKRFDELRKMGNKLENKDIREFIKITLADPTLTPEQKKTELEYAFETAKQLAVDEVQNIQTNEAVEAETEAIKNASDQQNRMYTEADRITLDENGNEVLQPGTIVGYMGNFPLWKPEGAPADASPIVLREGEYTNMQSMPMDEVVASSEQAIREDAAAQTEKEAKFSPDIDKFAPGVQWTDGEYTFILGNEQPNAEGMLPVIMYNGEAKEENIIQNNEFPNMMSEDEYLEFRQKQIDGKETGTSTADNTNPNANEDVVPNQTDATAQTENVNETSTEQTAPLEIPRDEKGHKQYHLAPVESTISDIQQYGLSEEETSSFVANNKEAAAKHLEKLQKKAPKIGTDIEEYQAKKKEWEQQVSDAQSQVDYWGQVESKFNESKQSAKDDVQEEIMSFDEPLTGEELAAQMLANGQLPLLIDSYKKETGFGAGEVKNLFGLFRSKEKGGMTIEKAGEQLMLADYEAGTNFFDQNDPNAGRNAIIDVLSQVHKRGDFKTYISNARQRMADIESAAAAEAEERQKEAWAQEHYGMSFDEADAYLSILESENPFDGLDTNEIDAIFVEAYNEYSEYLNQLQNEQGRTNEVAEGSNNVLSEERTDNSGTTGRSEKERTAETVGEQNVRNDEAAPEGTGDVAKSRKRSHGFFGLKPTTEEAPTSEAARTQALFEEEKKKFANDDPKHNEYAEVLQKSNSLEEAIQFFNEKIEAAQKRYNEWAAKKYKNNSTVIEVGDDELSSTHKSIGAINEARKRNAMNAALHDIETYKGYIETLAKRCGVDLNSIGKSNNKEGLENLTQEKIDQQLKEADAKLEQKGKPKSSNAEKWNQPVDDVLFFTITDRGWQNLNKMEKEWSVHCYDIRKEPDGWHKFKNGYYYWKVSAPVGSGRPGDNSTIWFRYELNDAQKKAVEKLIHDSLKYEDLSFDKFLEIIRDALVKYADVNDAAVEELEKIKKQAAREDGQLLILPSENTEEAGALSSPTFSLPKSKDREQSDNKQEKNKESESKQSVKDAQTPGLVKDEYTKNLTDEEVIDQMAKRLGMQVRFVEEVAGGKSNAQIKGNVILIEKNNTNPVEFLLGHELTHRMKKVSPKDYEEFKKIAKKSIPIFDWKVNHKLELYHNAGFELSREEAEEEVIADHAGKIAFERDSFNKFAESSSKSLLQVIKDIIHKIKEFFADKYERDLNAAEKRFIKALNHLSEMAEKEKMSEEDKLDVKNDEKAFEGEHDTEYGQDDVRQSVKKNEDIIKKNQEYVAKHFNRQGTLTKTDKSRRPLSKKHLNQAILNAAYKTMTDFKDFIYPYLDMEHEGKRYLPAEVYGKSTIFTDSSYGKTMENTLICMRTLAYIDFVNEVKKQIGRPLTVRESFLASQMLYDIAVDPQCLYCYVSLDRKAYDEYLLKYIEQRNSAIQAIREGKKSEEQIYKEFLNGRKNTPNMRNRFESWKIMAKGGEIVGQESLALPETRSEIRSGSVPESWVKANDKLKKLKKEARAAYKNTPEFLSALREYLASPAGQIDDAEAYAQSASWAKKMEDYRSYTGELLTTTTNSLRGLMHQYGLRFYSFSEYSPAFILENMQMITDASVRGLTGFAYTKMVDFIKIFAPSGININCSCFGRFDSKGNIVMDETQGANWDEIKQLREQYPNVGAVFVATNDKMVEWALNQDWIDVIIPFHIVRTGADVADFYKWVNYTYDSADKTSDNKSIYIHPNEHKNDKDVFLNLCNERGLKPRFANVKLSDGRSVVEHPNYMRLVNETRRSVDETPILQPIFNLDEAKRSFTEFIEKGGYYDNYFQSDEAFAEGVAQVVEDIKAGKSGNEVEYGRQDLPMDEAKLMAARRNKQFKHHQNTFEIKKNDDGARQSVQEISEEIPDTDVKYSLREEPAPKKVGKGYAVFVVSKNAKGRPVFQPKMIKGDEVGTPPLTWMNADTGTIKRDKEGKPITNTLGRVSVRDKNGQSLAWRPGKHLANYPNASQFVSKKDGKIDDNIVFFEVEFAMDKDYQLDAWSYGVNKNGKYRHDQAGLPYIPKDGFYMYRTNANPKIPPMIITGAFRITRALTDAEAKELNQKAGGEWFDRRGDAIDEKKLNELGLSESQLQDYAKSFPYEKIEPAHDESDVVKDMPGYEQGELDFTDKNLLKAIEENKQDVDYYKDQYETRYSLKDKNAETHKNKKRLSDTVTIAEGSVSTKKATAAPEQSPANKDSKGTTTILNSIAKLQKNLYNLEESTRNGSNLTRGFITNVSLNLNLRNEGASKYRTFTTPSGKHFTFRISNHNASLKNFSDRGENEGISLVISSFKNKGVKYADEYTTHLTEYFYPRKVIESAEGKPLADIVSSIRDMLETGEYVDKTGLAHKEELNKPSDVARYSLKEEQEIIAEAKKNGTYMKAPNGKKSNLNEKQWAQVRTTAFKNWFGDWENDPENASKVVDENGEPRVVYHQTNSTIYVNKETGQNWDDLDWKERKEWENKSDEEWNDTWKEQDFYKFDNKNHGRRSIEMPAFFFSPTFDEYHEYGNRTIEAFLNLRNPITNPDIKDAGVTDTAGEDAMNELISKGYDGFIREEDGEIYEIDAFFPNQVKSATDNNGEFSTENDDIRYSIKPDEKISQEEAKESAQKRFDAIPEKNRKKIDGLLDELVHAYKASDYENAAKIENQICDLCDNIFDLVAANRYMYAGKGFVWSPLLMRAWYAKHPEQDTALYMLRDETSALKVLQDLVDNCSNVEDLEWYEVMATEQIPSKFRKTVRKGINQIKKKCDERIKAIMAEKNPGAHTNFKKSELSATDYSNLFHEMCSLEPLTELFDKVMKVAEGMPLQFHFRKFDKSTAGDYMGDVIRLNLNYFNNPLATDNQKATTMLHELIHSVTSYAIEAVNNPHGRDYIHITPEMENAVKALNAIYMNLSLDNDMKDMYGMKNVKEMMAELSNPQFRDELRKRGFFEKILDALKKLFGIKENNALDQVSAALDYMLDNYDANAYLEYVHVTRAQHNYMTYSKREAGTLAEGGSYFSGGGLLEEGLKQVLNPKFAVEYEKKIAGVYRNIFGNHIVTADVRDVDPRVLAKRAHGHVDYFHASPVCKDFSTAKIGGEELPLDKATAQATAEAIEAMKPEVVTVENVARYRTSESLKIITDKLNEMGYTWDNDVYNAADYGAATIRKRMILRAVRPGMQLPPKPKHTERAKGWLTEVDDLIEYLPETNVPQWMEERLALDNIDWRNVDKPLYVFGGGAKNGKAIYAWGDELLPTLVTGGGDRIIMPGGKVLAASGRVVARISGIADDYRLPESDRLAHKIVGNGIPVPLTKAVIAPLIESIPPTPAKYSLKDNMYREQPNFGDGEKLQITRTKEGYEIEGLHSSYKSKEALLDAFRNKYPQFFSTITEDGNYVEMSSWGFDGNSTPEEQQEFDKYLERKTSNAKRAIHSMATRLGLDVDILETTDGLEGRKARAKGWTDTKTGKITIVLPNHSNQSDVMITMLHEGVAHVGLRKMFGDHFDTFLYNVYNNATPEIRQKIVDLAKKNGWRIDVATEEYLAALAEDTNFENVNQSWWNDIKEFFLQMLSKVGINLGTQLTDNELRYILWRSYDNLKHPGKRSILDTAEDVAKQYELKVGNYAENKSEEQKVAEIRSYNDARFNEELSTFKKGKMSTDSIFHLGMPQGIIKNLLPNIPIVMRQRVVRKGVEKKHNVSLDSLINMPSYISEPIFVFKRDDSSIGILTEMKDRDGKNVCVAIQIKEDIESGKNILRVNDVKSFHGREIKNVVLPIIQNGTLIWTDKEKALNWFSSASQPVQQEITNKELSTAVNIIKNFENPKKSDEKLRFRFIGEQGARYSVKDEVTDFVEENNPKTYSQFITAALIKAMKSHAESKSHRTAVLSNLSDSLKKAVSKARSAQRGYDKETVDAIATLATDFIKAGFLKNTRPLSVVYIINALKHGATKENIKTEIDRLADIFTNEMLREAEANLHAVTRTKSKTNQSGVEVIGQMDATGKMILDTFKEVLFGKNKMSLDAVQERIAELSNKITSDNQVEAENAAIEYYALQIASNYLETIQESKDNEAQLNQELKDAKTEHDAGTISDEAYKEFVDSVNQEIREIRIERVDNLNSITSQLAGVSIESRKRAKEFRKAEVERVKEIQHNANSDMEGRKATPHRKQDTMLQKLSNSSIFRFFFAPMATFDQMLRMFGNKSVNGEGYLYNRFMRNGFVKASEKEFRGQQEAFKKLDEKAREVFGKKIKHWSDLYAIERKLGKKTEISVDFWNGDHMENFKLPIGNALYIYMANKMSDGRIKLRKMGIKEEDVERLKEAIDPRFIELADWLQEEFLPQLRDKYNEVYERMFGIPMANIENYFPIRILSNARVQEEDVANNNNADDAKPSTITGSVIKRKANAMPLDILHTDALSLIIDHINEMEHWAAYAEFNRDLNTLLSYKHFRNQVQNMSSMYGGGKKLWSTFKDVAAIASGEYHPTVKPNSMDTAVVNMAKGVTGAKIAFRIFTALKQFLSFPAYLANTNPYYLTKALLTPVSSWNWAIDNLPMFERRWIGRKAGDHRLDETELDWNWWKNATIEKIGRMGMSPNAFVDAMTVSIGAKAIYETAKSKYLKQGYDEAAADKKAKEDAEISFNQTQQSNENAFLSPMQLDRSAATVAFTIYRNSSMGYQRQFADAIRNLYRKSKPGYKEQSIEFMTKQKVREGLDGSNARAASEKEYNRSFFKDMMNFTLFGFVMQFAWNMGPYLIYILAGDDDDDKKDMLQEAAEHALFGGFEGLTGGSIISESMNMIMQGKDFNNYDPTLLPLVSDFKNLIRHWSGDKYAAYNDLFNLAVQAGIGVNPQTITDALVAVYDASNGNLDIATEAMMFVMRVLQVPQSQIDKLYLDEIDMSGEEARKMTPAELARRYAKYRALRSAPLTGIFRDEDTYNSVIRKEEDRFKKKAKESSGEASLNNQFNEINDEAKEYLKNINNLGYIAVTDLDAHDKLIEKQKSDEFKCYRKISYINNSINKMMNAKLNPHLPKSKLDKIDSYIRKAKQEAIRIYNEYKEKHLQEESVKAE